MSKRSSVRRRLDLFAAWGLVPMLWGKKHEWHWYSPLPWKTVRAMDGTPLSGDVMRRLVKGE
jgi:hypothetical protein